MGDSTIRPTAPRATREFRQVEEARATGHAYVTYRDAVIFHAVPLAPGHEALYIGRDDDCTVRIQNDQRVSRRHARLLYGGSQWSIEDGPSRNGTFVGGKRTVGELILPDRAEITVGRTNLSFHAPVSSTIVATLAEDPVVRLLHPTPTQRKVLIELARPFLEHGEEMPVSPTNSAIAEALGYQVATIRDAISDLYRQAGLARGTIDQRSEIVRLAIREQVVTRDDVS